MSNFTIKLTKENKEVILKYWREDFHKVMSSNQILRSYKHSYKTKFTWKHRIYPFVFIKGIDLKNIKSLCEHFCYDFKEEFVTKMTDQQIKKEIALFLLRQ